MFQCKELSKIIQSVVGEANVKVDELMKYHTSFEVGGPADLLVTPETVEQLVEIIKICRENKVTHYVIGNGSNLLVRDGGIRGVVIKLSNLNNIKIEEDRVIAGSGATLKEVSDRVLECSLTGFEFASGIPGSVGGAVTMNAGAYDGEIVYIIESAKVIDEEGNVIELTKEQLDLGYRMSAVIKHGYIIVEATFKLKKGDYEKIKNRIDDLTKKRTDKQPLEYPSAGSTFKRPEGYFTGKLIEDSQLKGYSMGGAQVSEKHGGFIINKEGATAKDIVDLIEYVQETIKDKYNVELHTEVMIIGEEQ